MEMIGKIAVVVAAALAVAACAQAYESPAQHANEVGQPAVGLSSEPTVYDSTGAVVSSRAYASRYVAPRTYYPYPYPASGPSYYTYYPSATPYYPGGTVYSPYPSGYTVASTVSAQDQEFLREAMAGGAAEIELARYAYDRAGSIAVRNFAQQMVEDHARMSNHLNAVAIRKGVAPSTVPAGVIPADLATRTGDDFDEAYMEHMVVEHDRTLRLFEQEANSASDPEIRSLAASAIPTLEAHLEMADRVAAEVE